MTAELKEVFILSDGCGYQNRNIIITLSNALANFAKFKKIDIIHNYLEKGHTQME